MNTKYEASIEELKEIRKIIEDEADRLMDMKYELDELEHYINTVEQFNIPITKYNETIDRFNEMAEVFNSELKALRKLIDENIGGN